MWNLFATLRRQVRRPSQYSGFIVRRLLLNPFQRKKGRGRGRKSASSRGSDSKVLTRGGGSASHNESLLTPGICSTDGDKGRETVTDVFRPVKHANLGVGLKNYGRMGTEVGRRRFARPSKPSSEYGCPIAR